MARRIIHIEPTDAQWEVLDGIYDRGTMFVANDTGRGSEPTSVLWAELIVDDSEVRLYRIEPDGSFTYEELEGLNHGWTKYDQDGNEIEEDDDDE